MSKLDTALRLYRESGPHGIFRRAWELISLPFTRLWRPARRWWLKNDHWFVSKWVELTGNRVRIDGCCISVDHPSIPCRLKSRFALGLYESPEREAVKKFLDHRLPVVEFGGGIGVVSCVINRRLLSPSQHVVVEANAALLPQIEKNRSLNSAGFQVILAALGYGTTTVDLNVNEDYLSTSVQVGSSRRLEVATVSLREILNDRGWPVVTLVCDVEGAELELIKNERDVLAQCVALAIVEAHDVPGLGSEGDLVEGMRDLGFFPAFESCSTYVFVNPRRSAPLDCGASVARS